MAIVEMAKLKLLGLTYHREEILNAIHKTGYVQLIGTGEIADTFVLPENEEKSLLIEKYDSVKNAIAFIEETIEKAKGTKSYPKDLALLENFFVSYQEFSSIINKEKVINELLLDINDKQKTLIDCKTEKIKKINTRIQLEEYKGLKEKFSDYKDTKTTKVYLGTINNENLSVLQDFILDYPLTMLSVECQGNQPVISVVTFNEQSNIVHQKMSELGFVACPFDYDVTALEKINEIDELVSSFTLKENEIINSVCKYINKLHDLKIYADYLKFCIEKQNASEQFRCTTSTFVLEGYLPKEKQQDVFDAVTSISDALFIEFSQPTKEDQPPTLLKNNPVVRQTEFITDLYSVPNYRELDPSKVVFFFFMLFMGVIMADIGYGLLMILIGGVLAKRIKVDNGSRRLWYIVLIGGIFTVLFGVLFNSFFGFSVPFMPNILPSPIPQAGETTDKMMIILLGCLGLGVIQMATGYFCKAVNCFRQKDIAGAIFDGLIWVLFFIGVIFASFNFLLDYLLKERELVVAPWLYDFFSIMTIPGIIMVVGSIAIAALTAGRAERGFGKVTKGFGAVYGLINIMSDILSYARLFGLMLSGMIVAQTFNNMGVGMFASGGIGYVLGAIVMVIGHVFNIAMGVLGAYIHDSRLQYIEFFSKFYTGEGEKFTPLGSRFEYIYLTK